MSSDELAAFARAAPRVDTEVAHVEDAPVLGAVTLGGAFLVVVLAVLEVMARVDERRPSVVFAGAVAALAVLPLTLGRPFDSLPAGLGLTVLLAFGPAVLGARRLARAAVVREAPDAAGTLAMLGVVVLGAWVSWSTRLWDGALSHWGFSSELARGVLSLEHPLFPGEPLRYHVGFDVLVALVVACTGLSVDPATELVSTACLALLVVTLRDAGRALGGRTAGVLAVLVVPLGYGTLSVCLADGWGAPVGCQPWFPSSWVSAPRLPPPVISNFFQHPQGLAMPIAVATLLLAAERPAARLGTARTLVAALLLVGLAQVQIVFFAATGLAVGVATVVDALTRRALVAVTIRAASLLFALALAVSGGVLAGGSSLGELRVGQGYFAEGGLMLVVRHLSLFGLTLLAVPLALVRLRHEPAWLRAGLVVTAAVCFAVPNAITYARSWDIVKLFGIGAFFANLLLADVLAAALPNQLGRARGAARVGAKLLVVLLVVLSTSSGAFWLLRHGPLNGVVAFAYGLPPPHPVGRALHERHGDEIGPRERVLTTTTGIWHHGFFVAGADWRAPDGRGFMVDRARVDRERRVALRALRDLGADDLEALGVSWILLGPKDLARLSPAGRAALDDPSRFEMREDLVVDGVSHRLRRVVRAP